MANACFGSYKGQPALAASTMPTVSGSGQVKLYSGRPLTLAGALSSPSAATRTSASRCATGNKTDGDGKEDLVVISDQSGWMMYGR